MLVDNFTSHALSAMAYATCAQGQFRTVGGPFCPVAPFGVQDLSAKCPGGKQTTGGGVLNNSGSDYHTAGIGKSFPVDGADGDSAPDDAWQGEVASFTSHTVFTHATLVCVK